MVASTLIPGRCMSGFRCTMTQHVMVWYRFFCLTQTSLFLSGHICSEAAVDVIIQCLQGHRRRGKEVQSGFSHGCGGEGSWHRDLMHNKRQKSHCQGFPLCHSSAGDHFVFPQWDAPFLSSRRSLRGEKNGKVRWITCHTLSMEFKWFTF